MIFRYELQFVVFAYMAEFLFVGRNYVSYIYKL